MSRKQTVLHRHRKPAVERFLGLFKEGTKPRQLRLPTGQYRGYLIAELDDAQLHSVLHGYRGCHWDDVADVIEIEWHRRQLRGRKPR